MGFFWTCTRRMAPWTGTDACRSRRDKKVGPRSCHVLCTYWDRLWMVDRAGGYCGAEFQGFWGITHGDTLPPTILNMVVDAVVCHWILLVVGGAGEHGGWGREVLHCAIFLYADGGLDLSLDLVWMQE